MKARNVLLLCLAVLLCVGTLFVACNSEVQNQTTEIRFVPAVSKALNQDGKSSTVSTDVNDYHWLVYCSTEAPDLGSTDNLNWTEFSDNPETGIGTVRNLTRGSHLYFGLRGYTTGTNSQLIWEGFHKDSTSGSVESITLNYKTQIVTIDVYNKGTGSLYFNISAPMVYDDDLTSNTDRFVYSFYKLNATTSPTNGVLQSKYDSEDQIFYFANEADDPEAVLETGEYLLTVKQQTWVSDTNSYEDISYRKQVMIVSIQSGVDTVIAGTLDSSTTTSGMIKIDYEGHGYTDTNRQHLLVTFEDTDPSPVKEFLATVYREDGTVLTAASKGSHIAEGKNREILSIKWTSVSDMQIFVNGDAIKTSGSDFLTTGTDGYLQRIDGSETLLKTSGTDCLLAKVINGYEYIVTIVYKEGDSRQSVSFTVGYGRDPMGFSSTGPFTIRAYNSSKTWDGVLYYNIGNGWVVWDGTAITSKSIAFKGVGNTVISGAVDHGFVLVNSNGNISMNGNISAFFDYKKDPSKIVMGDYAMASLFSNWGALVSTPSFDVTNLSTGCFAQMFYKCTRLTETPVLPATVLAEKCYQSMFNSCTALTSITDLPATTLAPYCYGNMFSECSHLTDNRGREIVLPATTLADYCYCGMFYNTSLSSVPNLPATTLAPYCYENMFASCDELTNNQGNEIVLPATTLAEGCYQMMFNACENLTVVPDLNATTLAKSCYNEMFYACTALKQAPELTATTLADFCYHKMFAFCYNLVTPSDLPATTLSPGCYSLMYYYCTSLTSVPKISAETLAESCYAAMFAVCTNLKSVPEDYLPSTVVPKACYQYMFAQTGIEKAPALPATSGNCRDQCYMGMFEGCSSLKDLTLTGDVYLTCTSAKPGDYAFYSMFKGCSSLKIYSTSTDVVADNKTPKKIFDSIPSNWTVMRYGSPTYPMMTNMFGSSSPNYQLIIYIPRDPDTYRDLIFYNAPYIPPVNNTTPKGNGVSETPVAGDSYYIGI